MRTPERALPDRRQRALDAFMRARRELPHFAEALADAPDVTAIGRLVAAHATRIAGLQPRFLALHEADAQRRCMYAWIDGVEQDAPSLLSLPRDDRPKLVLPLCGAAGDVVATLELRAAGLGGYTPEHAAELRLAGHTIALALEHVLRRSRELALGPTLCPLRDPQVAASARDPLVVLDAPGLVVECNAAAARMFGRSHADVVGRAIEDLLLPPERATRRFVADGIADTAIDAQRILYIDDDEGDAELFSRLMERAGHRVQAFVDSRQALQAFGERPGDFDLVITDYHMPRMTGLQVASALREIRREVPVAIASANVTRELRARAREAGVEAVFSKRNPLADLPGLIRQVA